MEYIAYRVGSGYDRPPVELSRGSIAEARKAGEEYLLSLYGRLPTREPKELDVWVDIETEDGTKVESIYPSHGRKSRFIVDKPGGQGFRY